MPEAKGLLPDIQYADNEYEAASGADALVFVTEWNQFRALDMLRIRQSMRVPRIADLRNMYMPSDMQEMGFEYVGVGRYVMPISGFDLVTVGAGFFGYNV